MNGPGPRGGGAPGDDLRRIPPPQGGLLGKLQALLESAGFQRTITVLIVVNAVTLGLETSAEARDAAGPLLTLLDRAILSVFVLELLAKLVVYRTRFHKDPWNLFDFVVIGIALVPATGTLSVLRALRVLRVLRLVSAVPSMRRVVTALLYAIPGMGSIIALMTLIYYVFAVMATNLFGASEPELFGDLAGSAFTLFQIMTLEGWAAEIVRPVMEAHPYAWAFFVPFMLVTTFTVLNLFIGIIVDAMQRQHQADRDEEHAEEVEFVREGRSSRAEILTEIKALRREVAALKLR
ncbi:MAG: ion transporter [Alphaproteobacteria bacterium]|nr:ion transporter [Alphaproteobacteria bacterium]